VDVGPGSGGGRAATLLPTPLVAAGAVAAFANFAAHDLPAGWGQNVVMFSPVVIIAPALLASRVPALAATFGISAAQRESWRLGRHWWLYMTGLLVLLFWPSPNPRCPNKPSTSNAVATWPSARATSANAPAPGCGSPPTVAPASKATSRRCAASPIPPHAAHQPRP
jgi:hypothetical protein